MAKNKKRSLVTSAIMLSLGIALLFFGFYKLMKSDDMTDGPDKKSDVKTNLTTEVKTNAADQSGLIVREGRPSFQFATGKPLEVVSLEQFKSMQEKQKANRQVAGEVK